MSCPRTDGWEARSKVQEAVTYLGVASAEGQDRRAFQGFHIGPGHLSPEVFYVKRYTWGGVETCRLNHLSGYRDRLSPR
jgi:hypothetical protein